MAGERSFRIPDTVIHQTLDGEAVVINLDNGRYYALNDCASAIWNALAAGHSAGAITSALAPSAAQHASVERFITELAEQQLVLEHPGDPITPRATNVEGIDAFTEPRMEVYTDMERLLPLDPMHEVNERGWPNRKAGPDSN